LHVLEVDLDLAGVGAADDGVWGGQQLVSGDARSSAVAASAVCPSTGTVTAMW
jgi:hypothetical protein